MNKLICLLVLVSCASNPGGKENPGPPLPPENKILYPAPIKDPPSNAGDRVVGKKNKKSKDLTLSGASCIRHGVCRDHVSAISGLKAKMASKDQFDLDCQAGIYRVNTICERIVQGCLSRMPYQVVDTSNDTKSEFLVAAVVWDPAATDSCVNRVDADLLITVVEKDPVLVDPENDDFEDD